MPGKLRNLTIGCSGRTMTVEAIAGPDVQAFLSSKGYRHMMVVRDATVQFTLPDVYSLEAVDLIFSRLCQVLMAEFRFTSGVGEAPPSCTISADDDLELIPAPIHVRH